MIYKEFADKKLSALGLGCMRLPTEDGDNGRIDMKKTREMVDFAIKNGINYFDTAWGYHEGKSELAIGEILKAYPRESFYLASKFPGYDVSNMDKAEEIFRKQLEKCQVDYFDFYLFHSLGEYNVDGYLDPKNGIRDYLVKQKEEGRIKHIGLSSHAKYDTLKRFLDSNSDIIEFCQLQINWLDWHYQDAWKMAELVRSYNIPLWVMEPVRGGSLAKLRPEYEEKLNKLKPEMKPCEWAFRFLQGIPDVKMILSGMSNFEQLQDNIRIFGEESPLSDKEIDALFEIASDITSKNTLSCTSCRYCTAYCKSGLDIPEIIKSYNKYILKDGHIAEKEKDKLNPSNCIACRECENVCPQNIKISDMMAQFKDFF